VREARLAPRNTPIQVGEAPRFDASDILERLEGLREVAENALQAAGYLVLTVGAVWLLFRFAP